MKPKHKRTALAKVAKSAPENQLQAGPRSTNASELNYRSVGTLDPSRLATAFTSADQGFITEQAQLFELIEEQDAHIYSELSKRRRAVTGLGWQLQPHENSTEADLQRVKELEDMLRDIPNFEDMHYDLTDAIGKGFSAVEFQWKLGEVWLPNEFYFVQQRHFQVKKETGELQYVKQGIPESLNNNWLVHEHSAKSGYLEQSALFRVLAWTYAYKAYDVRDMQRFLELYGMPLRLGKFPSGIGDKQRNELLAAVRNIGNDGAGVVPSTMSIEFVQATARGNITDFLSAIDYWQNLQSRAILGGELDGKTATEAKIMVYDKVRREILLHDVAQIAPTINRGLLAQINKYNGMFDAKLMPKFAYQTQESVDQQKMVTVLEKATALGMEIDIEYAHEVLQIPKADKNAKLLGKVEEPKPDQDKPEPKKPKPNEDDDPTKSALTRLAVLAKQQGAEADLTDAYTAQLAALGAKHEAELVQKIAAVVAEAGDFDAAIAGIETLAINFKVPALAEVIALGMAAANLGGRAEIQDA